MPCKKFLKLLYSSNARTFAFSKPQGETSMKRLLIATSLACVLFCPAFAGEIPTGGFTPPPPPDPPEMTRTTSPGDIPTVGVTGEIPSGGFAQQAEDAMLDGFLAVVGWLA
jgi:hypothetical protein